MAAAWEGINGALRPYPRASACSPLLTTITHCLPVPQLKTLIHLRELELHHHVYRQGSIGSKRGRICHRFFGGEAKIQMENFQNLCLQQLIQPCPGEENQSHRGAPRDGGHR